MKGLRQFIGSALVGGLLVLAPIYVAVLLLLKAMQSLQGLVRPLTRLLPAWFPAVEVLSLVLVVVICFFVGLLVRTAQGRRTREQIERALFDKIPGYSLFKKLAQQVAGSSQEMTWKPALVEIEEALVPGFIIEELDDGSYTVFVPSVPTPLAGAVYILSAERVHPVDVPFAQAIQTVTKWGSGSKELVAAMKRRPPSGGAALRV
jgi:uncharacterized membrane protein